MRYLKPLFASLALFVLNFSGVQAQQQDGHILQAFYWAYGHQDYSTMQIGNRGVTGWADYLAELAPRLRELGVTQVWIPSPCKIASLKESSYLDYGSTGYSIFDHYDLGDKLQSAIRLDDNNTWVTVATPLGLKDELLRMIGVMRANGIDVVLDIVANHTIHSVGSDGEIWPELDAVRDPIGLNFPFDDGFEPRKNMRYRSFMTPLGYWWGDPVEDYANGFGRWPKNIQNFYPNESYNSNVFGNWPLDGLGEVWGPGLSYENTFFDNFRQGGNHVYTSNGASFGDSSNAKNWNYHAQYDNYTFDQSLEWIAWLFKQTGASGARFDAVKHYPVRVSKAMTNVLRHELTYKDGASAAKGMDMFSVGEYVSGSKEELDGYESYGGEFNGNPLGGTMGTFDFSFRQNGLKAMVDGNGGYNLANLLDTRQNNKHRTVPFVNNHDTFRPILSNNGNYSGAFPYQWNNGSELGGGHIAPNDWRAPAAYAAIMAVEGIAQIAFEDLFAIGFNGIRYTHDPQKENELPVYPYTENLLWCYNYLNFQGASGIEVRHGSADHLVIERKNRALIGINDNGFAEQEHEVATSFVNGTVLKDYSGGIGGTRTVSNGKVSIRTASPVWGHNNINDTRRGYSVWAPTNVDYVWNPPVKTHTVEWELSHDLGDSHPRSGVQGGHLPNYSSLPRVAGNIYPDSGKTIKYWVTPEKNTGAEVYVKFKRGAQLLHEDESTSGKFNGSFVLNDDPGYVTVYVGQRSPNAGTALKWQKAWVRVEYTAPKVVHVKAGEDRHPQVSKPAWPEAAGP